MKSKLVLRQLLLPCVILLAASSAHAASAQWNVDADGNWVDGGNWSTAAAPGATSGTTNNDVATFGTIITADRIVTVDAGRNIKFINFSANSKQYTLSGGSLVLTSGGSIRTISSGSFHNPDTVASPITLANANAATSGTLLLSAESTNDNRGLISSGGITGSATAGGTSTLTLGGTTVGSSDTFYSKITGDIADGSGGGTMAVVKTGIGMWILEGAKTFSGGLTVREGELRLASSATAAGTGSITLGDTTGTANATLTVASTVTPTNALTVAAGSSGTKTLACGNVGGPKYNGAITLNDALTVDGTSTTNTNFELAGASGISLNANNLTLRIATAGSSTITNTITVSNAVSGTGAIAIVGTGTNSNATRVVALNGTNSYTGGTTVAATGTDKSLTVNVSGDQSAATGGWTIGNLAASTVNFQSGSTIALASGKNMTLSNGGSAKALIVAGTVTTGAFGNLNVNGNSTLTLDSGANWTQNGGFINIQPQNSDTNAVMNVNSGASFTYAGVNNINLAKSSSAGNGSATLNLSGGTFTTGKVFSNSAAGSGSGTTNLNFSSGGTLKLSANIASLIIEPDPLKPFNVSTGTGGGIIDTNGFSTAIGVAVSGDGGLTKAGAGTLTLSGNNSYTGTTTISAGTLALSVGGSIDTGASIAIAAGAKLDTTAKTGTYAPANTQPITFGLDAAGAGTSGQIDAASLDITNANISFDIAGALDDAQYVLASYSGTLTGTFAASAPAGYTYDYGTGTNSQIKLIAASGSPYDTWAAQIPDTNQRSRGDDPDDDGFTNGEEFLFGTSPIVADGSLSTAEKDGANLIIRWKERTSGATYTLLQSATLNNDWVTATGATLSNDGAAVGDYQARKATVAIGSGSLFYRVQGVEN